MKNENLQAGKLEIEELSLVNYNGEVLDLQTFIYGFDVYEDIMSQTMSATLYMNDGNALIERLSKKDIINGKYWSVGLNKI